MTKKRNIFTLLFSFVALVFGVAQIHSSFASSNAFDEAKAYDTSNITLAGNIENRGDWSTTPQNGKWVFSSYDSSNWVRLMDVYMVTHSESNFRVVRWGSNWDTVAHYGTINTNGPGFEERVDEYNNRNIHITQTGYYNFYLNPDNGMLNIYFNEDHTSQLEGQIWVFRSDGSNNTKITDLSGEDISGFDFTFKYNGSNYTYKGLPSSKIMTVNQNKKYYVTSWTSNNGYQFSNYRLGYTDNTVEYTAKGSDSSNYKMISASSDSGFKNYILFYFKRKHLKLTLDNRSATTAGTTAIYEEYAEGFYLTTDLSKKMTSSANKITVPTKANYTFGGYYTSTDGGGTKVINSDGSINTSISTALTNTAKTLYAYWTPKTYTITLDNQSGEGGTSAIYEKYGTGFYKESGCTTQMTTSQNPIVAPTRTGYTFGGYYTATDGEGTQFIGDNRYLTSSASATQFTSNTGKLYAKWVGKVCDLAFDIDGGSGAYPAPGVYKATYGSDMPNYLSAKPTKDGYTFGGYYSAKDGEGTQYYTADLQSARTWNIDTTSQTTLYARWIPNEYTVTYHQNDGTGHYVVDSDHKIGGENYIVKAPADLGMGASGGRAFVTWNTKSDGSGYSYRPTDPCSKNDNLDFYMIQEWYTYEFSTDGGTNWTTLVRTGDTPEGYVAQFATPTEYSFSTGDTVIFRRRYGADVQEVNPTAYENNIHDGIIYYSTVGNLYVKVTGNNLHTVYVEGFATRGVSVERNGKSYKIPGVQDSSTQWTINNVTLLPGDTLKGVYEGGTPYTLYVENTDLYGITSAGVVSTPGVYTIYLKSNDGGTNFPNVYLQMEEANTAKLIAQTFNDALTTVCNSTSKGGATSQITTAFATQKNYYDHLTDNTQNILNGKTESSDSDVISMQEKYDYIVGKYDTDIAPNYLGRSVTPRSSLGFFETFNFMNLDEGGSVETLIIIIVSSVALISISGLSIVMIKRKKESRR